MVSQFKPTSIQYAIYAGHLLRHIKSAVNRHDLDLLSPSIQRFISSSQKYDEVKLLRQKVIIALRQKIKSYG